MNDAVREFHNIYSTHHQKIRLYLERLIGKEEAEDLTQEVFLKVNQGLKDFKGKSKLSTWIYRIATNCALDKLRSQSFQQNKGIRSFSDIKKDSIEPGSQNIFSKEKEPSLDRQVVRKEMNICIRDFIERLSPNYKSVIVLSELEGLKNQEIAEILGISLDTVKIRLYRARTRLKKELEEGCNFYHDERSELACDPKSQAEENNKES